MGYRWTSTLPDRRSNTGTRRSWFFTSENEARADAVREATGKTNLDDATLSLLWGQLARGGWTVDFEDYQNKDMPQ